MWIGFSPKCPISAVHGPKEGSDLHGFSPFGSARVLEREAKGVKGVCFRRHRYVLRHVTASPITVTIIIINIIIMIIIIIIIIITSAINYC